MAAIRNPARQWPGVADRGAAKADDEALKRVVRYSARPGARKEAPGVSSRRLGMTMTDRLEEPRQEALRLPGFAGGESVPSHPELPDDPELVEGARMTSTGIPGRAFSQALDSTRNAAPVDFLPHVERGATPGGDLPDDRSRKVGSKPPAQRPSRSGSGDFSGGRRAGHPGIPPADGVRTLDFFLLEFGGRADKMN
jgi:hypothetical protein